MGRSYSMDLRERVVASVNEGCSRREAARLFKVSDSCAVKLLQRVAATGSAAPARQGRPPGGGKLSPHRDFLIARVHEKPDITMPELAAELLAAHGVAVTAPSLSRLLCAAGFSYKKNAAGERAGTPGRGRKAPRLDRASSADDAS
jgi:transposase